MTPLPGIAFLLSTLAPSTNAFGPCIRHSASFSSTPLYGELDRVKSVGGGTGVAFPVGDLSLFDPEAEGKLQGTGSLHERIRAGSDYTLPPTHPDGTYLSPNGAAAATSGINGASTVHSGVPPDGTVVVDAQHWLEHLDAGDSLPLNFAKPKAPATASILARQRIITADAPGDIQHIILRLPEGMHYVEGQSLSVIPPGTDARTGRAHKPRLYSIASTRYGDALDGTTVSLCVRRAEYYNPDTGVADPTKKGVCSNFLCDALPGTTVDVAGPVGKTMLLPKNPNDDVIMIATGTGIAPFRAFLHRLFMEDTVARHMFGGTAWLVLGVPTSGGLLYKEEIDAMMNNAGPGQLKVDYAISREMKNPFDGGKLYVQHVMQQNAEELFKRLDNGASCYFCGLKGMMPPILDTLEKVAAAQGIDWNAKLKQWKDNHQWHVEVY